MDVERARKLVANPRCSRAELEALRKEALAAQERELAFEVQEAIEERFPEHGQGGRITDTMVRFRTMERRFATAKDAYLWLVERFIHTRPDVFTDIRRDTTGFVALGQRRTEHGRIRNYFAKAPTTLFRASPHLASDPTKYAALANGWYANTNLNNTEKFNLLCRFSWVVGLKADDWDWEPLDPTEELTNRKERRELGNKLVEELERTFIDKQT